MNAGGEFGSMPTLTPKLFQIKQNFNTSRGSLKEKIFSDLIIMKTAPVCNEHRIQV